MPPSSGAITLTRTAFGMGASAPDSIPWPDTRATAAPSQVVGFIKGKSAIQLARVYGERKRNSVGQHLWARGYFVSAVGRDEKVIRAYIRKQEADDTRLDQLALWR